MSMTKRELRSRTRIEWRVPAYLPYVQARLTETSVTKAESKLGIKLPKAYVAALREQNGGHLRFALGDTGADQLWGIGSRFPSILKGSIADRQDDEDAWKPRQAHRLIPFAGDGHWYLCFDGRGRRGEPSITYVDLEVGRERPVADAFEQLAGRRGREANDDERIGVVTDLTLDDVAKRLGKALRLKINDQGDWAHGYRTLHGQAKSGAQMWITPNEVRRGFVRKEHEDYATLVKRLRGKALRLPEHPDVACLIQLADLDAKEVLAACARTGIAVKTLGAIR